MYDKERWDTTKDESLSMPDLLVEKYQGIRPAVGYPSLPDQSINFLLDELLDMKQIGITLTENGAMYPHASVCGLDVCPSGCRILLCRKDRRRPARRLCPTVGKKYGGNSENSWLPIC